MRHTFPLVDVVVGYRTPPESGGFALIAHGVRIELFLDSTASTPATDCQTPAGVAISEVTVYGSQIPTFLGPDDVTLLYGRALGTNPIFKLHPTTLVGSSAGGGGSSAPYVHTQASAAATWIIPHNLGRRPFPRVVLAGDSYLTIPDVSYPDLNTTTLEFAQPATGVAEL